MVDHGYSIAEVSAQPGVLTCSLFKPVTPDKAEAPARPDNTALITALTSLLDVSTRQEFIGWTQTELQTVLPHGAFICGLGKVHPGGLIPFELISRNFPGDYLQFICADNGKHQSLILQRWLHTGKPQLFDALDHCPEADSNWLDRYKASGLRNTAAHGVIGLGHGYASYFSFHQMSPPLGQQHTLLLNLLAPSMHATLLRIVNPVVGRPAPTGLKPSPLTLKEIEVMAWICKGKTNDEIAQILGKSYKTVKNQVQTILIKLRVNNRAQAVAKAGELRLLDGAK